MGLVCSASAAGQTTGSAAKTQMLINVPSSIMARRAVAAVDFAGIDPTGQQIKCELVLGVVSGAGTSTSHTPTLVNQNDNGTARATAERDFSGEPTYSSSKVIETRYAHPQGKCTFLLRPDVKAGQAISIRTTPVSGSGPSCAATIIWEEV